MGAVATEQVKRPGWASWIIALPAAVYLWAEMQSSPIGVGVRVLLIIALVALLLLGIWLRRRYPTWVQVAAPETLAYEQRRSGRWLLAFGAIILAYTIYEGMLWPSDLDGDGFQLMMVTNIAMPLIFFAVGARRLAQGMRDSTAKDVESAVRATKRAEVYQQGVEALAISMAIYRLATHG